MYCRSWIPTKINISASYIFFSHCYKKIRDLVICHHDSATPDVERQVLRIAIFFFFCPIYTSESFHERMNFFPGVFLSLFFKVGIHTTGAKV